MVPGYRKCSKINFRQLCSRPHRRTSRTRHRRSCTRRFFLLRRCRPSHLSNPFLHPRPILLPTSRFMFCLLILIGHHHFCRQICMSNHPLSLAIIPMLRILKFTQHLRLVNLRHILTVTCKLRREYSIATGRASTSYSNT